MSKGKFLEVDDDSGIVTVVRADEHGFITLHKSLFDEFVARGGYSTKGEDE